MSKLNQRQKLFADAYIISGNATQSAIEAGYSEKTAYSLGQRLLKNVEVKAYIEAKMSTLDKAQIAKADEVLCYLTSVMRGKSLSSVVVSETVEDGSLRAKIIEKPPDEKERLKAAELLGKRYGLWSERVTLEGSACVKIIDDISPMGVGGSD